MHTHKLMFFTEISMDMKLLESCPLYANISFTFENIFSEIKKIICILTILAQYLWDIWNDCMIVCTMLAGLMLAWWNCWGQHPFDREGVLRSGNKNKIMIRGDKISEALLLRQRTYFLLRLIVNFTMYKRYIVRKLKWYLGYF